MSQFGYPDEQKRLDRAIADHRLTVDIPIDEIDRRIVDSEICPTVPTPVCAYYSPTHHANNEMRPRIRVPKIGMLTLA
ncbi:MAG: hypothetical protein V4519_01650 [Patescibacteria group bacterium]